jgi:predicted XRE-type DNA-binding protein
MAYMDSIFDSPHGDSEFQIDRVREVMRQLPDLEADFVELYYFRHWKQTDIATLFRVAQPTVHYRLQRATARIKYLLELPDLDESEMVEALSEYLDDPLNVEIMHLMLQTTCQTEVANILHISQGKVRHRFLSVIRDLLTSPEHRKYAEVFLHVKDHLNIMREVQRNAGSTRVALALI